ncbi:MAG: YihY/virulence factor BrkB family protein, partial [Nocardioidaceae bacterium]
MADNPEKAEEKPEPGLLDRGKAAFAGLRERWSVLDHVVRMVEHMGIVQGTMLAGAVTYFGFLSFFPVLVIAFAVISYVAVVVPEAREQMIAAIESIFPGLIGDTPDAAIDIDTFAKSAGAVGLVALVGLLYSGLGWISALRAGLQGVFQVPKQEQRNFVVAKVVDLLALAIIGIVLVVSVALSSAVANLTEIILSALLLDEIPGMGTVVAAVGIALGVAASTMLFFTIFTLLPAAGLPRRAMVKGAFV